MHVCAYMRAWVGACVGAWVHAKVHARVRACVCVCVCVCACVCECVSHISCPLFYSMLTVHFTLRWMKMLSSMNISKMKQQCLK